MGTLRLDRGASYEYEIADDTPRFIRYMWTVENDVRVYIETPYDRLFDNRFRDELRDVIIETRGDFSPLVPSLSTRPTSWLPDDKWSDFLTLLFQEPQMNIAGLYLRTAKTNTPIFDLLPKIKYTPKMKP